ncbi:VIT domain-containing protein [Thermopolyspora sp. NPDC052614]|uniref:VIT domain-containing protein n=1 Tax=Thermopolyspora sp. NPDC052614 TaxID=3155682 RepID=UPI00341C0BBA
MTVTVTPLQGDTAPIPDAGLGALATEKGNLPLESLDVTARLTGLAGGVEVVQTFHNPFDVSLEATYIFPLPDRAAVTAFRMEADGHVIEGVLKERGEARADYDRALSEGRRAAIVEEDRPDVFTMRVGNLVPHERVTVRLTLSQPLAYEDGAATFRFPLVVAPRYIPGVPLDGSPAGSGTAADTDAVPDASRISPPVLLPGFPNPVRLSLTTHVDPAGLDLREIRSSLHAITQESGEDGEDGPLTLRVRPGERLDRDFILRLSFDASTSLALVPDEPREDDAERRGGRREEAGTEGTFTLTVVPPAADGVRSPRDVVLLLDRSGSMHGWKMVAARRAAARIVDSLTSDDRFAVLSFDSVVERPQGLGEGLAPATDRNRYRAVEHLARLDARGGTELLRPLEEAIGLLGEPGRDRVLVLVTDGQVGNEDQILDRAGARLGGVRVHTVGIDRAVNAGFLGRLAAIGAGRCELVESEDRLDDAMEHIHRRIGAPLVTDLALKAEGLGVQAETVTRLGSLYPGVPLIVSGRYSGPAAGALVVHGLTREGGPWERRVAATVTGGGTAARAIWARARLRDLEDRYEIGERHLEREIVDTSLRFGVLCRFTAFVAVDSRVVADGEPRHQVVQPVELPSGWEPGVPAPIAAAPMSFTASVETAAYGAAPAGPPMPAPAAPPTAGAAPMPPMSPPMPPPAPSAPARPGSALGAIAGRMARGFAAAPRAARSSARGDLDVRAVAAQELTRLREAESLSPYERRMYLADLASRLRVLATAAGGDPDLSALAAELDTATGPDADLPLLWQRALDVLTRLSSGGPTPATERRRTTRAFWKRT